MAPLTDGSNDAMQVFSVLPESCPVFEPMDSLRIQRSPLNLRGLTHSAQNRLWNVSNREAWHDFSVTPVGYIMQLSAVREIGHLRLPLCSSSPAVIPYNIQSELAT